MEKVNEIQLTKTKMHLYSLYRAHRYIDICRYGDIFHDASRDIL